jgi:hypothetical protein
MRGRRPVVLGVGQLDLTDLSSTVWHWSPVRCTPTILEPAPAGTLC